MLFSKLIFVTLYTRRCHLKTTITTPVHHRFATNYTRKKNHKNQPQIIRSLLRLHHTIFFGQYLSPISMAIMLYVVNDLGIEYYQVRGVACVKGREQKSWGFFYEFFVLALVKNWELKLIIEKWGSNAVIYYPVFRNKECFCLVRLNFTYLNLGVPLFNSIA
uniref:Uncharacterized protein n=1 Tax=Solanum lycopersicum TaxID=4081 RepID=A0A3Q7FUC0_SOLLC